MSAPTVVRPNTPILDSGVLPPRKPKKRLLGLAFGFLIGLLFAVGIGVISTSRTHTSAMFFLYLPIVMLAVVLHELGHVAAGVAVGFHFSSISVGPFSIAFQYGKLKFQVRSQSGALGYAGMHIETASRIHRKLLVFVIAGPLTNLVSATVAAVVVFISPSTMRSGWLVPLCAAFSMLSLLLFVVSLLPFQPTLHSDGDRIRMLIRSLPEARRWISGMALASQQRKGIRSRRWKQTWLKAVCAVRDSSFDEFIGNLLAYINASDRKDVTAQATHLERCLELANLAPVMSRDLIASQSAYFCAWTRGDGRLAELWLSQMENSKPPTPLMGISTETALACARNDFDEALSLWQKGLSFIERLPSTQIKVTLEESWREWGDEINQRSCQLTVK